MYQYFTENYPWSLSVLWVSEVTGAFSELHDGIHHLRALQSSDPNVGAVAWYEAFRSLASQKIRTADSAGERGLRQIQGRSLFRAGIYSLMAVRFLPRTDIRGNRTYEEGVAQFLKGLRLLGKQARPVEVPYLSGTLPGLLALPPQEERAPVVMVFGGFDSLKEWIFPVLADTFVSAGVGIFVVDQAGVGGALRLHNLPGIPQAERSASACIDVLQSIPGVDSNRIGLAGISLGGYYAPRAAAFETRIKAVCAWGGIWDLGPLFDSVIRDAGKARSIPDMLDHARWVFGTDTREEAMKVAREMRLQDVIARIQCPLLVIHGANDRQVLDGVSEMTVEKAVNSRKAELRVFAASEGGAEHCQIDNLMLAADFMADWFAESL